MNIELAHSPNEQALHVPPGRVRERPPRARAHPDSWWRDNRSCGHQAAHQEVPLAGSGTVKLALGRIAGSGEPEPNFNSPSGELPNQTPS